MSGAVDAGDTPDLAIVEHVTKHFRLARHGLRRPARVYPVDDVSLRVAAGEVLGLVGESGSGKSTLARLLLGLVPSDSGRIEVDGLPVGRLPRARRQLLRRTAQLVFQDPHSALDPRMTVHDSLLAPLRQHRIGSPTDRENRIAAALAEVGLDQALLRRRPGDCSGGQLQRIVIARALLLEPKLLVCDEPTSALDAPVQATVLNLLVDLRRSRGIGILFISHDLRVVRFIADRVAVLYLGQVVEIASREELFEAAVHPYTLALLRAGAEEGIGAAADLTGEPPSPVSPPQGCRFSSRCALTVARCRDEQPPLTEIADGHQVRCHRWPESRQLLTRGAGEATA